MGAEVNLFVQVLVLDDRTRDQLGKQGHKGAKIDDIFLYSGIPPVYVDGIAHGLKGVKGDADGQAQPQLGHDVQADSG